MAKECIHHFLFNDVHCVSVALEGTHGWDIDSTEASGSSRLTCLRVLQIEIESQYKSRSALVSAEIEKELLMLETQGTDCLRDAQS